MVFNKARFTSATAVQKGPPLLGNGDDTLKSQKQRNQEDGCRVLAVEKRTESEIVNQLTR